MPPSVPSLAIRCKNYLPARAAQRVIMAQTCDDMPIRIRVTADIVAGDSSTILAPAGYWLFEEQGGRPTPSDGIFRAASYSYRIRDLANPSRPSVSSVSAPTALLPLPEELSVRLDPLLSFICRACRRPAMTRPSTTVPSTMMVAFGTPGFFPGYFSGLHAAEPNRTRNQCLLR